MISMERIRKRLSGQSEDDRYAAWTELYGADDGASREEVERILLGQDSTIKILFARYLSRVIEERAIEYLKRLLQDENPVVAEGARKAMDKNLYGDKLKAFLPLLDVPSRTARFYAIEKLAQGGLMEVVTRLMAMLPGADGELLDHLLAAFRYLPDKRLIPVLASYLKGYPLNIRLKTVLALSSLHEAGYGSVRNILLEAMRDEEGIVRKTAVWALRKRPMSRDLKPLMALSLHDPDPQVRQESLHEMGFFPKGSVIRHLLHVVVGEKNNMVTLKAEGILLSMPQKALVKGLKKVFRRESKSALHEKAILLFAHFEKGSSAYFRYLAKCLKGAPGNRERLSIIEAFGAFGNAKAIPLLEPYLHDLAPLAYGALTSILKIGTGKDESPYLKYLNDPRLSDVLKQMILKYFLIKGFGRVDRQALAETLLGLLGKSNLNIRYLSAQILVQVKGAEIHRPLLKMVAAESDPSISKYFHESLCSLLSHDAAMTLTLLEENKEDPKALALMLSSMRSASYGEDEIARMVPKLLSSDFGLLGSSFADSLADFFAFHGRNSRLSMETLFSSLDKLPGRERFLPILARHLDVYPRIPLKMPLGLLMIWMKEGKPGQTEAVIRLMALSHGRSSIPFLVAAAGDGDMRDYHPQVSKALNEVIVQ